MAMSTGKTCELVFAVLVITVAITLALYEVILWSLVIQYTRAGMPPTQGAPFPRLTICSRTFKNDSAYTTSAAQATYAMSLAFPTGNYEILQAGQGYQAAPDPTAINYVNGYQGGPLGYFLSIGYQCEGILQSCKVGGMLFSCCERNTQISNFYGTCASVDSGQYQTQRGLKGAMELRLGLDATSGAKNPSGFYLFTDDIGFFPGDPIFIPPSREIFVTLELGKTTKLLKPYGEFLCSKPQDRQFVTYGQASGYGQSSYYGNSYSLTQRTGSYDECQRQCLSQFFYDNCQCWPMPMLSKTFALYAGRYCYANDSNNCIEPLLNGTQVVNWALYTPKTTVNPLVHCDRTCPPPCLEVRAVAKSVVVTEISSVLQPVGLSQSSLIHLYYSSLDYGGTNEEYQWEIYKEVRELGLSICIWFTLAALLILSVRGVLCCKNGSWKENFANVPLPNMGRIWPTGNNRNGPVPPPPVQPAQPQVQMIQADPEKVPIQAIPTHLPPLDRQV